MGRLYALSKAEWSSARALLAEGACSRKPRCKVCATESTGSSDGSGSGRSAWRYWNRPAWADRLAPVTHEDGTVRVQTVTPESCPFLAEVLRHFFAITGVPLMLNTSLNTKGKPICCTPEQGLEAWRESGADALVIGGYWVGKSFDAGQAEINVALRETAQA